MTASLERAQQFIEQAVASERVPGAILIAQHRGKLVHAHAAGVLDPQTRAPLQTDSVLWLASMTKPIIAAALLALREDGRMDLDATVSRYIPEFVRPRAVRVFRDAGERPGVMPAVVVPGPGQSDPPHTLVPAEREITVLDLLTHTSGLQTITIPNTKIPPIGMDDTLASYVPRLCDVPLDFQPGSRWAYSNAAAFDVLARIVEVASGEELAAFLKRRIFEPLAMHETGFGIHDHARAVALDPRFAGSPVILGKRYWSGSAGLWGSLTDYVRFAEMLRGEGAASGARVLSPSSVALMAGNRVGSLFPGIHGRTRSTGLGFGLGVCCVIDAQAAGLALPAGSFGWDGVGTRRFWVVPSEELVMAMYVPSGPVQAELEGIVIDALRSHR